MFRTLIDDLIDFLSKCKSLSDVCFENAFDNKPLKKPIIKDSVYINLKKADISNGAFGDFIGQSDHNEFFGKQGSFTARLEIYVPSCDDAVRCCEVFSKISDALLFYENNFKILNISCGNIEFDLKLQTFKLNCDVSFKFFLSKSETQEIIQNIIIK
ncbi:MAG: hypothetical protein Q4B14_06525 [Clostridia bacterium]|nr:hypothetical protein [Clostridia bacterium]